MTRGGVPPRRSTIRRETRSGRERRGRSETLAIRWVKALLELGLLGIAGWCLTGTLRWLGRALRNTLRA
jgi:hypothetical protein